MDTRVRLRGHRKNVSVLLYPHSSQPSSYLQNILYSGGKLGVLDLVYIFYVLSTQKFCALRLKVQTSEQRMEIKLLV